MTAKEMQKLSAQKRWGKLTPEERSKIMARVRAGEKMAPIPVLGGNPQDKD
jgi:hypothetical protein